MNPLSQWALAIILLNNLTSDFCLFLLIFIGTYVKEFVHGDLGRTVPSVCSLLNCQVLTTATEGALLLEELSESFFKLLFNLCTCFSVSLFYRFSASLFSQYFDLSHSLLLFS